jgi:hypothetical protein
MLAQNVERKIQNFLGHKFWARGYFITTVGRDEEVIRAYIRNHELADQQLDHLELKISLSRPKIQSIIPTSLKTAFGGSQSNLQLCWRLLADPSSRERAESISESLTTRGRLMIVASVLCTYFRIQED